MSSNLSIDKRRRVFVRLIGKLRHELNQALAEEHVANGMTQAQIAAILNCHKSFVSRVLNGTTNMTLQTVADFAFALDRAVDITLKPKTEKRGANIEVDTGNALPMPSPTMTTNDGQLMTLPQTNNIPVTVKLVAL